MLTLAILLHESLYEYFTHSMNTIEQALDALYEKWHHFNDDKSQYPHVEYDAEWPSECIAGFDAIGGKTPWRPVKREPQGQFSNIEQALELPIHPDVKAFYGRYWSESLALKHPMGELSLIQIWNEEDFEYLQQNIIGHVMTKRTLKQPITVFIATTDEDDCNLVVLNDSGDVWLEYVGKEPHKKVADSLSEFIDVLQFS